MISREPRFARLRSSRNRNFEIKIYHRKFWDFIENPDYRDTDLERIAVSANV